jgi:hypothetical protein
MPYTWICIMAATIAVNTVFILSLFATLTWEQRTMYLFASAVIASALLFTIRAMRRLTNLH